MIDRKMQLIVPSSLLCQDAGFSVFSRCYSRKNPSSPGPRGSQQWSKCSSVSLDCLQTLQLAFHIHTGVTLLGVIRTGHVQGDTIGQKEWFVSGLSESWKLLINQWSITSSDIVMQTGTRVGRSSRLLPLAFLTVHGTDRC